MAADLG